MSFGVFDTAASGMHAQRVKMDVIASNIANINTTRNPDGTPGIYQKKEVTFETIYNDKVGLKSPSMPYGEYNAFYSPSQHEMLLRGGVFFDDKDISQGVKVSSVEASKEPYKVIYDPSHPDSNEEGYVTLPNVNVVEEMVDMVQASKAYEANATVAETTKSMITSAIRI